jgi:hypothetical protein
MDADVYLKERLEDQISWYDAKSIEAQRSFKRLRVIEIVAAAAIPLLSGFVDPQRPGVAVSVGLLGALVAVIAGVLGLFQFERDWVQYRATCESLLREKYLFLTAAEPFDREPTANYRLLVRRVEAILSDENSKWAQDMTHSSDAQDIDSTVPPMGSTRSNPTTPPVSP